jgi:hypothetical protein
MTRTEVTGILVIERSIGIARAMIMVAKTTMAVLVSAKSVKMATIRRRTISVEITAWWDGAWSGLLLAVSLGASCLFAFFAVSARLAVVRNPRKTRNSISLKKIRIYPLNQDKAMANPRSLLTLRLDMALKEAFNKVIKEAFNKVIKEAFNKVIKEAFNKVIKEAFNKVIKVGKDLLDLNSVFVKRFGAAIQLRIFGDFFG